MDTARKRMNKERLADFHAHVLPYCDHGCRSEDTCRAQLKALSDWGIGFVGVTPHFYPNIDLVSDFLIRRENGREILKRFAYESGICAVCGAETLVCEGMENMSGLDKLVFENTNTLLLEMPFSGLNERLAETVDKICDKGFSVVIAHVDRYQKSDVEMLLDLDVGFQINGSGLKGILGKRRFRYLFDDKRVVALGSDIHGRDIHFAKELAEGYKKIGSENCRYITDESKRLMGFR